MRDMLAVLIMPLKVKETIDIDVSPEITKIDMNSLVGKEVTLLCKHSEREITEAPDYKFVIISIANDSGTF